MSSRDTQKKSHHHHEVFSAERAGHLDTGLRRFLYRPERLAERFVKPGYRVLDFGCGPGFFTREFAKRIGVNEKSVRDSIKLGRITKGVKYDEKGKPRIDYLIAYNESVANSVGKNSRMSKILSDINALSIAIDKAVKAAGETALRLSELQKRADQWQLSVILIYRFEILF